jgi:hypothetical protein
MNDSERRRGTTQTRADGGIINKRASKAKIHDIGIEI